MKISINFMFGKYLLAKCYRFSIIYYFLLNAIELREIQLSKIPGGFRASNKSQTILLLKYSIGVHLIPSLTYSSCSAFNVNSINICCNFSFTKFMLKKNKKV